jgi:hypothetical protein
MSDDRTDSKRVTGNKRIISGMVEIINCTSKIFPTMPLLKKMPRASDAHPAVLILS